MQNEINIQITEDQYNSLVRARELLKFYINLSLTSDECLSLEMPQLRAGFLTLEELIDQGLSSKPCSKK